MSIQAKSSFLDQISRMNADANNVLYMSNAAGSKVNSTGGFLGILFTREQSFTNATEKFLSEIQKTYGSVLKNMAVDMIKDAGGTGSRITVGEARDIIQQMEILSQLKDTVTDLDHAENDVELKVGTHKRNVREVDEEIGDSFVSKEVVTWESKVESKWVAADEKWANCEPHAAVKALVDIMCSKMGGASYLPETVGNEMKAIGKHMKCMLDCLRATTKAEALGKNSRVIFTLKDAAELVKALDHPHLTPEEVKGIIMRATQDKLKGKALNGTDIYEQVSIPPMRNKILEDGATAPYFKENP